MSRIITIPMDSQPTIGETLTASIHGLVVGVRIDPMAPQGVEVDLELTPSTEAEKSSWDQPIQVCAGGGEY